MEILEKYHGSENIAGQIVLRELKIRQKCWTLITPPNNITNRTVDHVSSLSRSITNFGLIPVNQPIMHTSSKYIRAQMMIISALKSNSIVAQTVTIAAYL